MNILAGNFLGTHDEQVDQRGTQNPFIEHLVSSPLSELVLLRYILLLKTMLLILFNTMDQ